MDVSVLMWKVTSDFNWLFLLNPAQQLMVLPDDGNTFFWNIRFSLEHEDNTQSPEILYSQTPMFWYHILHFTWFHTILSGPGQMPYKNLQPAYFQWVIDYGLIFWCNSTTANYISVFAPKDDNQNCGGGSSRC